MLVEAFLTLVQVPPNILLKTRKVRKIPCGYPMQGTLTSHILSHLQDVNPSPIKVRLARLVCHLEQQVVLLVLHVLHIPALNIAPKPCRHTWSKSATVQTAGRMVATSG